MFGTLIGDIIGSPYEHKRQQTKDYNFEFLTNKSHFTGDSVLTVATINAMLTNRDYAFAYRKWCSKYPNAGYRPLFKEWLLDDTLKGQNSFGNDAAVRAAPIGWMYDTLDETILQAKHSASVSHTHREALNGAKAVAGLVFLARKGFPKQDLEMWVESFYDLDFSIDEIRPNYSFNSTCKGSVPQAIVAFLESHDFESCIRNAVSLGGDANTQAAIAASIAEAYSLTHDEYRIPDDLLTMLTTKCPPEFISMINRIRGDYKKFKYPIMQTKRTIKRVRKAEKQ